VSAGLPAPAVNEPIFSSLGEWLCEPDLSYDDVRLAIEYNGALHADLQRMRRDMTRAVDITYRGGWQTIAFGPAEVFAHPDLIGSVVGHLRRERAHIGDWRGNS
jgi:very-short-patch-repair endonuclease